MYECDSCMRTFGTQHACNQHMTDTNHHRYACETCSRDFGSWAAARQHMNAADHWAPRFPCQTCSLEFGSAREAERHMSNTGHYENYCRECDRHFQSGNNYRMHMNSRTHRGRNMQCPFCAADYTTASGLSHHLESGSCPRAPSLNRETIYRAIRLRDERGLITNRQIGWRDEDNAEYEASSSAFNGYAWECYLCHCEFGTKKSLDQHLNSPRHKQKVYKCPNTFGGCEKQFVSLAGLFGHLESEQCAFIRFEKVQAEARGILAGRRMIAF